MVVARLKALLRPTDETSPPRRARGPSVPPGERVYAIGDVHGRLDLLETLLDWIDADDAMRRPARSTVVFLGDLIDRGPHSRQVIDHVIARDWRGRAVRHLQGNHEEVMLLALSGDLEGMRFWSRIGGEATLESYGVPRAVVSQGTAQDMVDALLPLVPRAHTAFLNKMEDRIAIGNYLFVHAGIRPGIAVEKQKVSDLRWIRDEFLAHEGDHGAVVVHGHTITDEVEEYPNRIGIDTGAFASGRLTALVLDGDERDYLAT